MEFNGNELHQSMEMNSIKLREPVPQEGFHYVNEPSPSLPVDPSTAGANLI